MQQQCALLLLMCPAACCWPAAEAAQQQQAQQQHHSSSSSRHCTAACCILLLVPAVRRPLPSYQAASRFRAHNFCVVITGTCCSFIIFGGLQLWRFSHSDIHGFEQETSGKTRNCIASIGERVFAWVRFH